MFIHSSSLYLLGSFLGQAAILVDGSDEDSHGRYPCELKSWVAEDHPDYLFEPDKGCSHPKHLDAKASMVTPVPLAKGS